MDDLFWEVRTAGGSLLAKCAYCLDATMLARFNGTGTHLLHDGVLLHTVPAGSSGLDVVTTAELATELRRKVYG